MTAARARKYSETNRSSPLKPSPPSEPAAPVFIDSAARYRPAGQPSVRSVRSESSLASSSTPAASSSNAASCSSSRRSATPISCTCPFVRQRASGSAGSSRLATAIRDPAGTYRTSSASTSRQDGLATRCRSSSASTSGPLECGQSAPETRDAARPSGSARAGQRVEHLGRNRLDPVNRRRDVAQEHHGVAVSRVERDPRERTRISLGPTREQGRLAVPGGRHHGHEGRARSTQPRDHVLLRRQCPAGSTAPRAWPPRGRKAVQWQS